VKRATCLIRFERLLARELHGVYMRHTPLVRGDEGSVELVLYIIYIYIYTLKHTHAEPTNCENWQADRPDVYNRSKRSLKRCQDFSRSPGRIDLGSAVVPILYIIYASRPTAN